MIIFALKNIKQITQDIENRIEIIFIISKYNMLDLNKLTLIHRKSYHSIYTPCEYKMLLKNIPSLLGM